MAKSVGTSLIIQSPAINTSGLNFARMSANSPPVSGAQLGVDVAGNVVVTGVPTYRSVLLSNIANPGNSTADVNAISATIPAGRLTTGSLVQAQLVGNVAGGNSIYNFWIKVGTTKVLTVSFQVGLLVTISGQWALRAYLTARSSGSTATFATYLQILNDASGTLSSATGTQTIDTTIDQTVTAGFNWTNGANGNVITATQGIIAPM